MTDDPARMSGAELAERLEGDAYSLEAITNEQPFQSIIVRLREAGRRLQPAQSHADAARKIVELWDAAYCKAIGKTLGWLEKDPLKAAIAAAIAAALSSATRAAEERIAELHATVEHAENAIVKADDRIARLRKVADHVAADLDVSRQYCAELAEHLAALQEGDR